MRPPHLQHLLARKEAPLAAHFGLVELVKLANIGEVDKGIADLVHQIRYPPFESMLCDSHCSSC